MQISAARISDVFTCPKCGWVRDDEHGRCWNKDCPAHGPARRAVTPFDLISAAGPIFVVSIASGRYNRAKTVREMRKT